MSKLCNDCEKYLPDSEFYSGYETDDGLSSKCKGCTRAYAKARRQNTKTRTHILSSDRERNSTLRRRAQRGLYKLAEKERNPEKTVARNLVAKAIRTGLIERQPCVICGELPVEAHHEDYAYPLEITWVCKEHHTIADKLRSIRLQNERKRESQDDEGVGQPTS